MRESQINTGGNRNRKEKKDRIFKKLEIVGHQTASNGVFWQLPPLRIALRQGTERWRQADTHLDDKGSVLKCFLLGIIEKRGKQ